MPIQFTYPNAVTLQAIAQNYLTSMTMEDPIFKYFFPIESINSARLRWEILDNYQGLMNARGLGGQPTRVNEVGVKTYETLPGAFGEFMTIDETYMTEVGLGLPPTMLMPHSVNDRVKEQVKQLVIRYIQRMKQMAWALAGAGTISVSLPSGGIDFQESYAIQAFTVSPLWTAYTTAHPLQDMRSLQYTYGRGTSNSYMTQSRAFANSQTWDYMFRNTNAADWGGRRIAAGGTLNGPKDYEELQIAEHIPILMPPVEDGYIDNSGTFQLFIPDGRIIIVAARPDGELPGKFLMTANANNPNNAPGVYSYVKDFSQGLLKKTPPAIETHVGFNGGNVVQRATQIVVMTVQ